MSPYKKRFLQAYAARRRRNGLRTKVENEAPIKELAAFWSRSSVSAEYWKRRCKKVGWS